MKLRNLTATFAVAVIGLGMAGGARAQYLTGAYYHAPPASINGVGTAIQFEDKNTPTGSFTATNIAYTGHDGSLIQAFLGIPDGLTYKGGNGNIGDGIIHITGTLSGTANQKFDFNLTSDDGALLTIGGKKVIDTGGVGSSRTKAGFYTFATTGSQSFDLQYFNHAQSPGAGPGGAGVGSGTLSLTTDNGTGGPLTHTLGPDFRGTVPEPATFLATGTGLLAVAGYGLLTSRRKRAATA